MRNLFLTSGLILCLVCPAFADIASGTSSANCEESVLDSYTGPVDFVSVWRPAISGAITLDSNRYSDNNGTSVQTASTTATPTPLYSVYGVGVYSSQPTVATLDNFTTSNRLTVLTRLPVMTGYSFTGFFTAKYSGGHQITDASGNFVYDVASKRILTDGGTETWYAQWAAKTFNITYSCGSAPSDSSSTVSGSAPNHGSATYNSSYTISATYGSCALSGYAATGWDCTGGAVLNNVTGSQSTWSSAEDISCTVHWTPNTINLNYYQDENATTPFTTGTCTYDGTFDLPTNYQSKNGYHFNGWIVR